jgi:LAS superfamily LD-carboxypeptidase LdcB
VRLRHQLGFTLALAGTLPWACAPKVLVRQTPASYTAAVAQPAATAIPEAALEPPALSTGQLLGFRQPPHLAADPDSGKMAQAAVIAAYEKLKESAAQQGWHLILVSGYRSYWHQVQIWNDRYRDVSPDGQMPVGQRLRAVMAYVDLPGLSRHQWGTELDISEESLRGQLLHQSDDLPQRIKDFYKWMDENAPAFGFCRTYKGGKGLIQDEPWHWSYQPYSKVYSAQMESIQDFSLIQQDKVQGSAYILKHFQAIYKGLEKSVDPECCK